MYNRSESGRVPRGDRPYGGRSGGDQPSSASAPLPAARLPSYRQRVRVPVNYSGNAIVDGEARPLGAVGERQEELQYVADRRPGEASNPSDATPHFEGLPYIGAPSRSEKDTVPAGDETAEPAETAETAEPEMPPKRLFGPDHFPFGHGMGSDEWLLLGLMFFLLGSSDGERGDLDETLLLLGILLFCG